MNKLDLFVAGCREQRWKWRLWRISIFAPTKLPPEHEPVKYDIDYRPDGIVYYDGSEWVKVEGNPDPDAGLYRASELANFPADTIPNNPEPIQTTYGRMLFNWMCIVYAFHDKLPFQHNNMPEAIVTQFAAKVIDEVDEQGNLLEIDYNGDKKNFYPTEVSKFVTAIFETASLCPYITPTGSVKSLTTHPEMVKTRNMLLNKYRDQLNDPAIVTMIQNELIELDKAWLKGDNAEGYYTSGKSFSVKRKKLFVMHGIEASFREGNDFELIEPSLAEGWDMNSLVAKYNATREGSYDRGKDTALGGEKVTFLQRIYQNVVVVKGDCGTKNVHKLYLEKDTYKNYIGMNIMVGQTITLLSEEVATKYMNSVVNLRRPILCKLPLTDYCEVCATAALAKTPRAAAAFIADVGSKIMYAFMSSMHGTELSVAHYDFKRFLT